MFPLDPFYFVIALAVGLLYSYLTAPKPKIVVMYPTPDNAGKITYRDDAGVCYKYRVLEMACPSDPSMIKEVPIQI
jgi:hypothetical protein